jgi:hypothetical protein
MLQQFRHLYDHLTEGSEPVGTALRPATSPTIPAGDDAPIRIGWESEFRAVEPREANDAAADTKARIDALLGHEPEAESVAIKSVAVVETTAGSVVDLSPASTDLPPAYFPPSRSSSISFETLSELWELEFRAARRRLEPDGALTGATREVQAALGTFLATCHEHGVKVGPWRLPHVVPEFTFGEHPTYGVLALAHWACRDAQPWKVGIGLFLARGAGKPKDLEIKLSAMDLSPTVVDHLILLRPEDDLILTGKSKQLWSESEKRGQHARLEPVALDGFALLASVPRWLAAIREALPDGTPLPNLADVIQAKCDRLLEQLCMPVTQ